MGKSNIKDISGNTYQYLTVESYAYSMNQATYWNCRCVCGNKLVVLRALLTKGDKKSCGCIENISGKVFGRLTALYFWEVGKHGKHVWLFLCDCGKEHLANRNSVTKGNTKSCGCLHEEVNAINLVAYRESKGGYKGEGHPNWKGGITPVNKLIRASEEYKAWRTSVFSRDNYLCQGCLDPNSDGLNAHHIIHFSEIIKKFSITTFEQALTCRLLWSIDNGKTLCMVCHQKEHPELALVISSGKTSKTKPKKVSNAIV
jgi:hypothetical protein